MFEIRSLLHNACKFWGPNCCAINNRMGYSESVTQKALFRWCKQFLKPSKFLSFKFWGPDCNLIEHLMQYLKSVTRRRPMLTLSLTFKPCKLILSVPSKFWSPIGNRSKIWYDIRYQWPRDLYIDSWLNTVLFEIVLDSPFVRKNFWAAIMRQFEIFDASSVVRRFGFVYWKLLWRGRGRMCILSNTFLPCIIRTNIVF